MDDPRAVSERLRELQSTARQILSSGVTWMVYELPSGPYDRRQTTSLIFEAPAIIRRVREFPRDWRGLQDEELMALSWAT
jgi:hypothetical protein